MANTDKPNAQQTTALVQFARHGQQLDLTPFMDNPAVNNLSPAKVISPLSEYFMVGLSVVRLSPDTNQGDVYKDGNQYRPSKVGLMKLAAGAGIQWYTPECKLVYRTESAACFQAVGFLIGPDGVPRPIKGTKEIDLKVFEDEARFEQEDKTKDGKLTGFEDLPNGKKRPKFTPWKDETERQAAIDLAIRKATLQKRKNLVALCETGAYLRAIRSALTLKSNWTAEEIAKPFVMVRTYLDPEADRQMVQDTIRSAVSLGHAPMVAPPQTAGYLSAPPAFDVAAIPEAPDLDGRPGEGGDEGDEDPDDDSEEGQFSAVDGEEISEGELDQGLVIPESFAGLLAPIREQYFSGPEVSWNDDPKRRQGPYKSAADQLKLHEYNPEQTAALFCLLHFAATGEVINKTESPSGRVYVAVQAMTTAQLSALRDAATWWAERQGKAA